MTGETIYTVNLSYTEIGLLSYAMYKMMNATPPSERAEQFALFEKLQAMRCVENVATPQLELVWGAFHE